MSVASQSAVVFRDITLAYEGHPAVHHLSGSLACGSLTAIVGPNGAGKSTLLKGIVGLMRPAQGAIERASLSRGGIAWIIRKYQAKTGDPTLAGADLSPHVLRHSKAMHLCEVGVPLPYIRDILGHAELATTDIYARASTEAKRKALEAAYTDIVTDDLPEWNQDPGLLNWLANL